MSEAVATKKIPESVRLVLVLLVISLVTSVLLGLANLVTAPNIARIKAEKEQAAKEKVLLASEYTEVSFDDPNGMVKAVFRADNVGYVVQVASSGFAGAIDMMVGVTLDGTVTGVDITGHSETSGLGAKATRPAFKDQFIGATGVLAVTKDGGTIDAITGATITSRAVADGVNAARAAVATLG